MGNKSPRGTKQKDERPRKGFFGKRRSNSEAAHESTTLQSKIHIWNDLTEREKTEEIGALLEQGMAMHGDESSVHIAEGATFMYNLIKGKEIQVQTLIEQRRKQTRKYYEQIKERDGKIRYLETSLIDIKTDMQEKEHQFRALKANFDDSKATFDQRMVVQQHEYDKITEKNKKLRNLLRDRTRKMDNHRQPVKRRLHDNNDWIPNKTPRLDELNEVILDAEDDLEWDDGFGFHGDIDCLPDYEPEDSTFGIPPEENILFNGSTSDISSIGDYDQTAFWAEEMDQFDQPNDRNANIGYSLPAFAPTLDGNEEPQERSEGSDTSSDSSSESCSNKSDDSITDSIASRPGQNRSELLQILEESGVFERR